MPNWVNLNNRFYMPEVGRFGQVDPVTETQENYSLYQYGWGNPVLRSDPNGDFPIVPAIPFIIEAVKDAILAGAAIYTASELGKELSKGKIEIPTSGPSNNSSVPMWVQQRSKQMNSNPKKGDYSNIPDPKNAGDGKKTTPNQRKKLLEENKSRNNGKLKSDGDGRTLNPPKANAKGKPADLNQAEVDHKKAKSKGGSNKNSNLRVISKEENLKKSNKNEKI